MDFIHYNSYIRIKLRIKISELKHPQRTYSEETDDNSNTTTVNSKGAKSYVREMEIQRRKAEGVPCIP